MSKKYLETTKNEPQYTATTPPHSQNGNTLKYAGNDAGIRLDGNPHMTIKPKAFAGDIPVYCSHDEIVDIMKVIPNPKNPNKHGERQIEILSQVIKAQGWRKPITVSKRSGFVVSGHGRLQAALLLDVKKVPVDYQDYANEAEEYADLVADNRIAELSTVDEDLLIDILNEINGTDIDTILTGYEYHEIDDLLSSLESEPGFSDFENAGFSGNTDSHRTTNETHEETYPHSTPSEEPRPNYDEVIQRRKDQTGEIDIEDFAEERYTHECPKCKFRW